MHVRALSILLLASTAAADLPQDQLRQGESRQSQIRSQTQQVADELAAIIEEFRRNNLDGDDVAVLTAIRSVLHKLSDQEMQQVISLLQSARSTSDLNKSRTNVVGAISTQKNIAVQLRALLLEYQRQQALYDLSIRLGALAERQHDNLKSTVALTRAADGKTGSQFDENERASLSIQTSEQQALKDEINPLVEKLQAIAADADGPTKDRLAKALEFTNQSNLRPELDSAVEDLRVANLFRAAGTEKSIRDDLRDIARLVAPPKDALAALRAAAAEVEKAIDAQKQLVEETKELRRDDRGRELAEALESRQADLVDKSDQLQKDLEALSPETVNELKQGQDQMQEARADLTERNRDKAIKSETAALKELEEAKQRLDEAIASAEPAETPTDRLAAAKALHERTRELIKQEEALKQDTTKNESKRDELKKLSPKQDALEKQTRQLHKEAVAVAPEAARSVNDAANQMDKADQQLAKPNNPREAQDSQAAAIASLQQADEALGKEIAQLEEAQKDLEALTGAREKVENLIKEEQRLETATAKAEATKDSDAPKQLADEQSKVAQDTEEARKDLQDKETAVAEPLKDAQQQMADAQSKLQNKDAKSARPAQQQALSNLFKAKGALDNKIDQLRDQLGQQPDEAQAMADAMKQIEQLKEDVALADQSMNDSQTLQKSLVQQQKRIAEELAQMDAKPAGNATLPQAQHAAASAADHLAQGDFKQAARSMAQAQQGMKPAMNSPAAPENLPQVSKDQAELQKAVEQLASGQPPDPSQPFEQAAQESTDLAASDEGSLPTTAAQALQQAAQQLSQAAAAAASGKKPQASQQAADAQASLSQAAAALSLAQAGVGSKMAQGQGQKGQQPGKQPGPSKAPGQGQQGQSQSTGNRTGFQPGQEEQAGAQRNDKSGSAFLSLPDRDRKAIAQSQNDKYPEEYAPQIEQYLKNLSDQEPE